MHCVVLHIYSHEKHMKVQFDLTIPQRNLFALRIRGGASYGSSLGSDQLFLSRTRVFSDFSIDFVWDFDRRPRAIALAARSLTMPLLRMITVRIP